MSPPRLHAVLTAAAAVAAVIMIAGCGSPKQPAEPRPPSPPPPAVEIAPPDLASGPWGAYRSDRFNVRIPLPDAPSWTINDDRSPWLEAKHKPASAALIVRLWREGDVMNRARCEARARLWKGLPERERAEMIEQRRLNVPQGFDTVVDVGVLVGARGQPVTGFAMAFGVRARRCFAYVLLTNAAGKGAEELIATRLATMVELSLSKVTLEDDLDPNIPHEPGL